MDLDSKPWRAGQAAFNVLAQCRPDVAAMISGSADDPFYDDDRLPRFYAAVDRLVASLPDQHHHRPWALERSPTEADRDPAPNTHPDTWVFIGLDGETSSPNVTAGGRLIQAGFAAWSHTPGASVDVFSRLIGHPDHIWDSTTWDERAAAVHGISRDVLEDAPEADEVDEAAYQWLIEHGAVAGRQQVIAVGLNVASFDLPFFRQTLPRTAALISHRAVDLNSLCFTYAGWDPHSSGNPPRDFAGWKQAMKQAANTELCQRGLMVNEHDAGYDAAQALIGWWWLRRHLIDLTGRLDTLDTELCQMMPLRAVLGADLLEMLAAVDDEFLSRLVAAVAAATSPRLWFTTWHPQLETTPVNAIRAGRFDAVLTAASG